MRKLLLLLAFIGTIGAVNAQSVRGVDVSDLDVENVEIIITKRLWSKKVNVKVDAGQDTKFITFSPRKNYFLIDKGSVNNRMEFNSTSAVLDFFSKHGYKHHGQNGVVGFTRGPIWKFASIGRGQRLILHKMKM